MSINEDNSSKFSLPVLSMADIISFKEVKDRMNMGKISLNETGVSPRVFNSWKNSGLIPVIDSQRRWNKFNFIEFLWIEIIKELREFGLSIEKIIEVKKLLFDYDILGDVASFIAREENRELIFQKIDAIDHEPEVKQAIKEFVISEPDELRSLLKSQGFGITLLDMMVLNSVAKRKSNGLIIYSSGKCIPWFDQYYETDKDSGQLFEKPHIFLSFSSYLFDFLFDKKMDAFISTLQILSNEEHEILLLLRNNELKEIKIKFNEKSNKPYLLEVVSGKQVSNEEAKQLMRNIIFKNYESISFKTNNNKTVYIEKAVKKIL